MSLRFVGSFDEREIPARSQSEKQIDSRDIHAFLLALTRIVGDVVRMNRANLDSFQAAGGREGVVAPVVGGWTLDAMLDQWAEHLAAKNRDAKYVNQQRRAVRLLCAFARVDHPSRITAAHVNAYRDDLLSKQCSGSLVNNQLSAFRQFFKWGVRFEVLNGNPARDVENAARHDGDGNREFTPAEASRMVEVARADESSAVPQHGAIRSPAYVLAWNTGLRNCELGRLRWEDARGIGGADPYIELSWKQTKNRRAVQIPLNAEAAAELAKWIGKVESGRDLMFPSRHTPGLPQLPHDRVVDRDIRAAGIAKLDEYGAPVGMHSFRKGGATALAASGEPEIKVAQFLRHSDPKLTRKVYIRLRRQELRCVSAAVPNVDKSPAHKIFEKKVDTGADLDDTRDVTQRTPKNTTTPRPRPFGSGCVTNTQPDGPGRVVVSSDSRSLRDLPNSEIAGVGFEPAPARSAADHGITLNLTVSTEAIGAFIRALIGSQGAVDVQQHKSA